MAVTRILSNEILQKIRKHEAGTADLAKRPLKCLYCGHKEVEIFEDARGHVKAKCKKCGREAVYNIVLCRNGTIRYRVLSQ